jgi:hypothetical protein
MMLAGTAPTLLRVALVREAGGCAPVTKAMASSFARWCVRWCRHTISNDGKSRMRCRIAAVERQHSSVFLVATDLRLRLPSVDSPRIAFSPKMLPGSAVKSTVALREGAHAHGQKSHQDKAVPTERVQGDIYLCPSVF